MSLTLTITSYQRQALGPNSVKATSGDSLSIGRSPHSDWTLPDSQGAISREHARIERRGAEYVLTDLSVNGTFVNDSAEPLGNGKSQRLTAGDRILIGDYEIVVTLDSTSAPVPARPLFPSEPQAPIPPSGYPQSGPVPPPNPQQPGPQPVFGQGVVIDPLVAMAGGDFRATNSAIDARVVQHPHDPRDRPPPSPLHEHFPPPVIASPFPGGRSTGPAASGTSGSQGALPEKIDFTTIENRADASSSGVAANGPAPQPAVPSAIPPFSPAPPEAQPPAPGRESGQHQPQDPARSGTVPAMPGAAGIDMVRLLMAAGLDQELARAAARDPRLAEAMGHILQSVVTGLIEVLRARAHIKQQFRLNLTQISANQNNPLKLSGDANAALYSLFVKPGAGFLTPVQAVDEAFNDIKAHQMAVLAGMRAAFDQMFERFDPEKLQQRFDKGRGSSMLNAMNKARYWEEFIAWYADLAEDRERGFQRLFGEEFAKAYEQQMQRIVSRGRAR